MSSVTNAILTWPLDDVDMNERLDQANDAARAACGRLCSFKLVKECCQGGTKFLEHNVAIGAINHLNLDEFIKHLKAIRWNEPHNVRLFICGQNDDAFKELLGKVDA